MGQDGFDYSFQADYGALWDLTVDAVREVAEHNPAIAISIEYKPNEPRSFALAPDVSTTLMMIRDVNRPNFGVTLDFAHALYASEMPAYSASLVARHSRLLGVHLNDGYGKRDDGLMAGSVHPLQTIELLYVMERIGCGGAIYFDTFPDATGLDPTRECEANIETIETMRDIALRLGRDGRLAAAIANQGAVASNAIVRAAVHVPRTQPTTGHIGKTVPFANAIGKYVNCPFPAEIGGASWHCHVWTTPADQWLFSALRWSRVRSCLRLLARRIESAGRDVVR